MHVNMLRLIGGDFDDDSAAHGGFDAPSIDGQVSAEERGLGTKTSLAWSDSPSIAGTLVRTGGFPDVASSPPSSAMGVAAKGAVVVSAPCVDAGLAAPPGDPSPQAETQKTSVRPKAAIADRRFESLIGAAPPRTMTVRGTV